MQTQSENARPKLKNLKFHLKSLLEKLKKNAVSKEDLLQKLSTILSELGKVTPLMEIENATDRHKASTARTSFYVQIMALATEKGISIPLTPKQEENLTAVGVEEEAGYQQTMKDVNQLKEDFNGLLGHLLDTNDKYNDSRIELLYNVIKSYGTLLFNAQTPAEIDTQVSNIEIVLREAEQSFQYETGVLAVFQPILNALSASVAFIANLLPKLLFPEFWLGKQEEFVEKYGTPKTTASQVLETSNTKLNFFGNPEPAAGGERSLKDDIEAGKEKITQSNKFRPRGV